MSRTVAVVFVLVYLFIVGFRGYMYQAVAPVGAIEVRARGFQWGWDFEYSNGAHTSELRVPVGKPVKMVLSSNDVLHSFYIPAFRVKQDLVPGRRRQPVAQTTSCWSLISIVMR